MKKSVLIILCLFATQSNLHALDCKVKYKVKRIVITKFLLRTIKTPEYKIGIKKVKGSSKKICKKKAIKALKPLTSKGWKILKTEVLKTS